MVTLTWIVEAYDEYIWMLVSFPDSFGCGDTA